MRLEPEVSIDEEIEDPTIPLPTLNLDSAESLEDEEVSAARREPRFEPRLEPEISASRRSVTVRFERPSTTSPPAPTPQVEPAAEARTAARTDTRDTPPAPTQKIVALRIAAMPAAPFEGARLREAIEALGFEFGRYRIFHRLDASGRSVFSLASLKEPGTLDPEAMEGATFHGLAMFAVLPGPWPAARTLDDLLATARALATRLGGQLQDERGSPLTVQRVGELRKEAAEFERSRVQAAVR
jgi:cell division protein ZipA